MIPSRIQDLLCPENSPLSLLWLLGTAGASSRIPQRLPGAGTVRLRGAGTPRAQKKGQKSFCSRGQELGELQKPSQQEFSPLTKSSREASPKIHQEEAASLTTWGGSLHLSPWQFHLHTLAGKSESLPSCEVRAKPPSFLISQFGNQREREREKNLWAQAKGELEKAQVPFFKGGRLVGIPGSLNLGVNTFPWLGVFSLFLNFHTGA